MWSRRLGWVAVPLVLVLVPVLVLVLALLAWWFIARAADAPGTVHAAPAVVQAPRAAPAGVIGVFDVAIVPPAAPRVQLVRQYQLALHTLCSYEEASQYPPGSRPMAQNADQAYPNAPVTETQPMRGADGATNRRVLLHSAQSRVYLVSGESVAFSLRAVDPDGAAVPLVVTRAAAAGIRYGDARTQAAVAVDFTETDGAWTGVLAPVQTGLAGFDGTIRTQVAYRADGKDGSVSFDVIHSPVLPALWAGPAHVALDDGAVTFHLPADVRVAGRYIVTGRVDDARGAPFALLTFNGVLPAGPNDVRLTTFGKLLRDGAPMLPLTLRDVDGYLLRENADPDRALMPRLEGVVATSDAYPAASFSAAPYDGAERARYLAEFGRDVARARADLQRADPLAALPDSACPPAPYASLAR